MIPFTSEHSTLMINLDTIQYAQSSGHIGEGCEVTIWFIRGNSIRLTNADARMFLLAWERLQKASTKDNK